MLQHNNGPTRWPASSQCDDMLKHNLRLVSSTRQAKHFMVDQSSQQPANHPAMSADDDCPLAASEQSRNILCFAGLWCLYYLAAPVSYVGVTHANLLKALGGNDTVANLPHAVYHVYPVQEHGQAIFEFAAQHRAVVMSHSSEKNSLASDLVDFANEYPDVRLILAHIGHGWDGDYTHQVRAVQQSRHGNLYADTSSARSITPNLIEWAVHEIGADRILFGTDTPLYHAAVQRARIDHADVSDPEKGLILCQNAERLFGLSASEQRL